MRFVVLVLQRQRARIIELRIGVESGGIGLLQRLEGGLRAGPVAGQELGARKPMQKRCVLRAQRSRHRAFIKIDGVLETATLDAFLGQCALGVGGAHQFDLALLLAIAAAGIDSVDDVVGETARAGAAHSLGNERERSIGDPAERRRNQHDRQDPQIGTARAHDMRGEREVHQQNDDRA